MSQSAKWNNHFTVKKIISLQEMFTGLEIKVRIWVILIQ